MTEENNVNEAEVSSNEVAPEMNRRHFINAAIVGGALASTQLPFAAPAAGLERDDRMRVLGPEYDDKFDLSMYVYGQFTCRELFTDDLPTLTEKIKGRINFGEQQKKISSGDAVYIRNRLNLIAEKAESYINPITLRDFYLKTVQDAEIINWSKEIAEKGLFLTYAWPDDLDATYAALALHLTDDDSLISDNGCYNKKIRQLYKDKRPDDYNHPHIRAIGHAKRAGIFGPHGSRFADYNAYFAHVTNGSGYIKANDRCCVDGGCESNHPGYFCSIADGGGCSLMSDVDCPPFPPPGAPRT